MSALRNPQLNNYVIYASLQTEAIIASSETGLDSLLDNNFQAFIEGLKIITKQGGIRSLLFNIAQEQVWHWWLSKREVQRKARGICAKSRQEGVSTLIEAICFGDCIWRPGRYAYVASLDKESAAHVFGMSKLFYENLPKDWKERRPLKSETFMSLKWKAPHNSKFTAATANKKGLGRGQTIHDLHLSEPAQWPNPPANDAVIAISNCVPDHWDTLIFWESTANGAHNLFHQQWQAAQAGDTDFDPIFLSWKDFPEYFFYFPDSDGIPEGATVVEHPEFDETERVFAEKWGICDEQMAWASDKRRNSCHNDWNEFNQEYPIHDSVAFKFSGRKWFDAEGLEVLSFHEAAPLAIGRLEFTSSSEPLIKFVEDVLGNLEIWEWPISGCQYIMGGDIAEGVGGDFTVFQLARPALLPDEKHRIVAKYRSNRISAEQAAVAAFQLLHFYGRAFCGIEKNNQGLACLTPLHNGTACEQMRGGYPNLFYHTVLDRKTKQETQRLGWSTNGQTKPLMLGHFQEVVRNQRIIIPSKTTRIEMEGFAWDAEKEDWVQTYRNPRTNLAHDDEIISVAITLQMILHCRDRAALKKAVDGEY